MNIINSIRILNSIREIVQAEEVAMTMNMEVIKLYNTELFNSLFPDWYVYMYEREPYKNWVPITLEAKLDGRIRVQCTSSDKELSKPDYKAQFDKELKVWQDKLLAEEFNEMLDDMNKLPTFL